MPRSRSSNQKKPTARPASSSRPKAGARTIAKAKGKKVTVPHRKKSPKNAKPARERRLNAGNSDDLLKIWPGLLERARQLLAKERREAGVDAEDARHGGLAVGTIELALSGLRRQKRASQGWSSVGWDGTDHAMAAGYQAMNRALIDKARARDARPDRIHAGDLTSEFLAPLIEAGALRREDIDEGREDGDGVDDVLRAYLLELEKMRPDIVLAFSRVCLHGDSTEQLAAELGLTSRTVRFRVAQCRLLVMGHLVKHFPKLEPRMKAS